MLSIPGCPHTDLARRNVDRALAHLRLAAVVRERIVASAEDAAQLGMRGSPTILVDGRDLFARPASAVPDDDTAAADAGLSCRLYPGPAGVSGAPTVSQIVEAMGG